ncbi:MAG: hypothetical protein AAB414_01060 [Patescibacteria group bacterium]
MSGLEQKNTSLNPSEVSERITTRFTDDVTESIHFIESNPLLVVSGAIGIGKTTSFIPLLNRLLMDHGFSVQLFDWQRYDDAIDTSGILEAEVDKLPAVTRGVLIIDEARSIIDDGEDVTRYVLQVSHDKGYKVIAVHPYYHGQENARFKYIAAWRSAEEQVSGHPITAYTLNPKALESSLARDYLTVKGYSPEVIDILVRILPLKMVLLGQGWNVQNPKEALRDISRMYRPWFEEDLLISKEDFNHINQALKIVQSK